MELYQPSTIRALLKAHGFSLTKSLGQNFLINRSVCPRMAKEANVQDSVVVEIGPGIGVLTAELARRARRVIALELDSRLLPVLSQTLAEFDNVQIVQADALRLNWRAFLQEVSPNEPVKICANLPYYITSPMLMTLLEGNLPIDSVTVMVQKEAAERICAPSGTRQAGAFSLAVSYYAAPKWLFYVSRGSFYPAPRVDSAVISLTLFRQPPVAADDPKLMFYLIKTAFSQRRKMLLNPLSDALGLSKQKLRGHLCAAGIPEKARPEELSLAQFAALSNRLGAETFSHKVSQSR